MNSTCVRVSVLYGHSEAIHIETRRKITAEQAYEMLARGMELLNDPQEEGAWPTPVTEASAQGPVFVGRIRKDGELRSSPGAPE